PRIGEAGGKADLLDEALRLERGFDLPRGFAAPALIAVVVDLRWNLQLHHIGAPLQMLRQSGWVQCVTCPSVVSCASRSSSPASVGAAAARRQPTRACRPG